MNRDKIDKIDFEINSKSRKSVRGYLEKRYKGYIIFTTGSPWLTTAIDPGILVSCDCGCKLGHHVNEFNFMAFLQCPLNDMPCSLSESCG